MRNEIHFQEAVFASNRHFNAAGQPDNYAGKLFVFMEPLLAYALLVLAELFPKIDPKKASYERFPKAYQLIQVLVQILLLGTNVFTLLFALGYQLNMTFLLSAAVGLMFVVLGNYMPKFKQTFFCGIRTPFPARGLYHLCFAGCDCCYGHCALCVFLSSLSEERGQKIKAHSLFSVIFHFFHV